MKLTQNKNFKLSKSQIKLEFARATNVQMLEFDKPLTKQEADLVGDIMFAYEQEKQRLLARLSALNDVQILNSYVAGQPLGIVIPDEDIDKVKEKLG